MRFVRFAAAVVVCSVALVMPYRLRIVYNRLAAVAAHAPFFLFGRLARFLLNRLDPRSGPEDCR
jgi:hypothetical protein